MGEGLLARINSPEDLKQLDLRSLEQLAGEIRQIIVSTVEKNGGHLGANLGVVELTLALHSVLSAPRDKIIWDVGHQCYTHKLLRSEEHTSELQSRENLVCRLLLEKKKQTKNNCV